MRYFYDRHHLSSRGQIEPHASPATGDRDSETTQVQRRNHWFYNRRVTGRNAAQLRKHAYDLKLKLRVQHAAALAAGVKGESTGQSSTPWTPLGPYR
jgi:hypothetical protein